MLYPEMNEARNIVDLGGAWLFRLDDGKHSEGYADPAFFDEANLMAGNQAEANACLNEVRQRAKLPFKEATLDAIKIEKRLELFCEYTRYQDIIRWKDAENLLKHQGEKTPLLVNENDKVEVVYMQYNKDPERYGFKPRHYLLPIPATEIRQNPSMVQNEGW